MNMTMQQMEDFITDRVHLTGMLTQLAREAFDLSLAAHKMCQAIDGTGPASANVVDASKALREEVADVCLILRILCLDEPDEAVQRAKLKSWVTQLGGDVNDLLP